LIVCKVIGKAVSTIKDKRLTGQTMLVVRQIEMGGEAAGPSFVALDVVGAGEGEIVGVVQGSSARAAFGTGAIPVDAAVVVIFDSLTKEGKEVYRK
jgi:ethanolamine utilization protein EutN